MKKLLYAVVTLIVLLAITVGLLELTSSYTASENTHKDAPVQTVQQIEINATPEKVYQVMSNIDNWASWQPAIQDPKLEGPFQKGASFNWATGGLTIHSTIHTAIPNQKLGWSGKAFGAFAVHNWTFIAENGKTKVIVEESMEGWLVKLMKNKFQAGLEKSLQVWLEDLKKEAEK